MNPNDYSYRTQLPFYDELRGERVSIRPFQPADAPTLRAAVEESRERVRPWLPWADAHQSDEETRDLIVRWQAKRLLREDVNDGIWEGESGRLLGGIGLHPRSLGTDPSFEIGYWLRTGAEGHGFVSEAVRLVTDAAFDQLHAVRVEIRCDARNIRSASVARRLGFMQEAHLRRHALTPDGALRDTLIFARIPSDPRW
jgi:RimJ/RimL family protein N-acetyltransferase